ncbi:MAG: hypothetical protein NW217_07680 [Hyphomicrobiaceae bacterium]|nr:hypothetical protein [Hyphomicrobiaceae bacterium]
MSPVSVNYWAEGPTDRAAARKLIRVVGGEPGADYSIRSGASPGKDFLDARLRAFNEGAKWSPWLILRDTDGECAAQLVSRLLADQAPLMRFRLVVSSIEAWLMADRGRLATFLGVRETSMVDEPELLPNAKQALLDLIRTSSQRRMRDAMLPDPRSGRREGPDYASSLIEFINDEWDPESAARRAPSLGRALIRLREIVG